ncbi:FecR domain-containing protein [Flagellatimonas centrodinii]|uniref:FecR family protein n=1 Tax=Flagellatimonas centrodinii TaxID=2806210 RepID=UPI001FEF3CCF|nr:FecR domain-containing protein [Flagellatimonas centrodinii]ULQ47534.1 FecR domain-containing protein [Flagellatimonas centrodinii]
MNKWDPRDRTDARDPGATPEIAAAHWSETLRSSGDDPILRRAFQAWYDLSDAHAQAFARIESARERIATVADTPALMALRNETLNRVALRRQRWPRVALAMAASLVAAMAGLLAFTGAPWQELPGSLFEGARLALNGETLYRTAVGERLVVTLDDGTRLTLNTDSRLVVGYQPDRRDIRMQHGQALFEVAKDANRPFVVAAGGRQVTALGTAFDVRVSDQRFEVTLIEGKVEVAESVPDEQRTTGNAQRDVAPPGALSTQHSPLSTVLSPGQQLIAAASTGTASTRSPPLVRQADIKRVTSWRNGQVIFEDDLLGNAIIEMNRYAKRRIAIADPALAELRLSGAFDTGQTGTFIEALTTYFPVTVARQNSEEIVLAWHKTVMSGE